MRADCAINIYYSSERRLVHYYVVERGACAYLVAVAHDSPVEHHSAIRFIIAANYGFESRYHIFGGELRQITERAEIDAKHGSAAPAYESRGSDHRAVAS